MTGGATTGERWRWRREEEATGDYGDDGRRATDDDGDVKLTQFHLRFLMRANSRRFSLGAGCVDPMRRFGWSLVPGAAEVSSSSAAAISRVVK